MDNRQLYLDSAAAVLGLVRRIPDDAWDNPALGSWDVRALVGHTGRALSTITQNVARPAATLQLGGAAEYLAAGHRGAATLQDGVAQRGVDAGAALGADPAATFASLLAEAEAALAAHPDPDEVIETVLGAMRLGDYLDTRVVELVVHGTDLAACLRTPIHLPTDAVAATVAILGRAAVLTGQGERLLRLATGRDGSTFSVVL